MCQVRSLSYGLPSTGLGAARRVVVLALALCGLIDATHSSRASEPDRAVRQLPICSSWGGLAEDVVFLPNQPHIAVVALGPHLAVVDLTNPQAPQHLGSLAFFAPREDIADMAVLGDHVFIVTYPYGNPWGPDRAPHRSAGAGERISLYVVDVSRPARPHLVGSAPGLRFQEIELYEEPASFRSWAFLRDGTVVYAFDISNPRAPAPFGEVMYDVLAMKVLGNYLYCLWERAGLRIYRLGRPPLPGGARGPLLTLVGEVLLPDEAHTNQHDLEVAGDYAYCSAEIDGEGLIYVINVADPTQPVVAGSAGGFIRGNDLAVSGDYLFVADWPGGSSYPGEWAEAKGLAVLDVSDPAEPRHVGQYKPRGLVYGVEVVGERAYIMDEAEGLLVLDVSDPTNPLRLGHVYSPARVRKMALVGSRLYVTDLFNGFSVLDVSDPFQPRLLFAYQTPHLGLHMRSWGIDVVDGLVYLCAGWGGFQIVNVSDPAAAPYLLGEFPFPAETFAADVLVQGDIAHVGLGYASGPGVFLNLDVSDPRQISLVGGHPTASNPRTIVRAPTVEHRLYYSARYTGIMDSSDPETPVQLYEGYPRGDDIACLGDLLLCSGKRPARAGERDYVVGLFVLDVSDPFNPVELSHFPVNHPGGVDTWGSLVYLLAVPYDKALLELDLSDPLNPHQTGVTDLAAGRFVLATEHFIYATTDYSGLYIIFRGLPGDLNCDGVVDAADIAPFVLALGNRDAYAAEFPDCTIAAADINGDQMVNAYDIDGFILLLGGG
ncbi:MAG: dockerin type I domain-containing protein [Planctomycetota bacterium]